MGMEHLCPLVKNIRQTANKTPCKGMTKLPNWEASGGLLQFDALTDLLVYHLRRENPRPSFSSSSHCSLPIINFARLAHFVTRSPPPVSQAFLVTGGERSATDVSLSLVTTARLFIFPILPFQKAFCVAETLSLRIPQSSDAPMTLLSLLLTTGNIFNFM